MFPHWDSTMTDRSLELTTCVAQPASATNAVNTHVATSLTRPSCMHAAAAVELKDGFLDHGEYFVPPAPVTIAVLPSRRFIPSTASSVLRESRDSSQATIHAPSGLPHQQHDQGE